MSGWRARGARRTAMIGVLAGVVALASACLPGADLEPKSGAGNNPGNAYLHALFTNVRTGMHTEEGGYDRVVFDFLNFLPRWTVQYVDKPVLSDGEGAEVPIAGDHVLQVRMQGAAQAFFTPVAPEGYIDLYPGPERIGTGHPQVVEVVMSGDFEAVVTWNIGTRGKVPFRVMQLDTPHRLVVDVAHR